jgi:hypothetical protein
MDKAALQCRACFHSGKRDSRLPRSPSHRLDNLLRIQVPDVSVRRCQAGMAQLLLDDVQRGPLVRQLERVSVPQAMGVDSFLDPGLCGKAFHQIPDIDAVQWATSRRAENGPASSEVQCSPSIQPSLQDLTRRGIEPHQPGSVALPVKYPHGPPLGIAVLGHQAEGFAHPQAATVKDDEQGPVPNSHQRLVGTCPEQSPDLILG